MTHSNGGLSHPRLSRRAAIQAGGISLLGMGMNHVAGLHAHAADGSKNGKRAKSCIFIFLSGGLAQHDSFDMKPNAPVEIRGEFQPISTRTPGIQICEHLPLLAQQSHLWSLCRSLTHSSNEHSAGHVHMLTGRSETAPGFNPSRPMPSDHPSIPAIVSSVTAGRNNLPPAIVLPE